MGKQGSILSTDLKDLLAKQLELQIKHMKDGDPQMLFEFDPDGWAQFMVWNAHAMTDELHEAFNEIGWKPWATSRHLHVDKFRKEMVDTFHFFMNLLLASHPGCTPDQIAELFCQDYYAKNKVNAKRQEDRYDGVSSKCPTCHRDLAETDPIDHYITHLGRFCSKICVANYEGSLT